MATAKFNIVAFLEAYKDLTQMARDPTGQAGPK
jgi:hypothetical protein